MTHLLLISTLVTFYLHSAAGETCTTPDGFQGTCVGWDSCPLLANKMQINPKQFSLQYVQSSSCKGSQQYSVCCALQTSTDITSSLGVRECHLTSYPPDPSTECCGTDASGGGNRIIGGTPTAVDEYPWLALIEYTNKYRTYLLCGGALISGRYVLTAGHCIAGDIVSVITAAKVRLGEYDTSNDGSDCVDVEGGGEDCTEGPISIHIQKIIPYPDFDSTFRVKKHDIALIRLVQLVQFTDFIRPICLPTADFTRAKTSNVTLIAAGWGATETENSNNIKLKVRLPYVPHQRCQPFYKVRRRRVNLWEGQMCAGGESGKDSCNGDSGGPLMRYNGRYFELVGIVSFGLKQCGKENVPAIYTKVFHYLPWIRSHIVA